MERRSQHSPSYGDSCGTLTRASVTIYFKMTRRLWEMVLHDLARRHPFAAERVGFLSCKPAASPGGLIILAADYHPVGDEDYLPDQWVGAMMGPNAIRKALQFAYNYPASMFHVHLHDHKGTPSFSKTDSRESAKFVPDFFNVQPNFPHGALIFSKDSIVGRCWYRSTEAPVWISKFTFVGSPMRLVQTLWPQTDIIDKVS